MGKKATKRTRVEASSGNVFADLGLPDAADLDTKARLAVEINRLIVEQRLTQATAASRLDVSQPKISALKNYRLDGFSVERLMSFLTALGLNVEIRITRQATSRSPGKIVVHAV